MPQVLTVALAVVGGLLAGRMASAWLALGRWRRATDRAADAVSWRRRLAWLPVALAVSWGLLAWHLAAVGLGVAWPAYAALAVIGVLLSAVDLAVHRLPDHLTLGGLPLVLALLVLASALVPHWHGLSTAAWAAGLALVAFTALVLGGLGLGDLKLAVLLGLALGWLGLPVALVGLVLGFLLGGVWAAVLLARGHADRHTAFAFGPWLLLGAHIAVLLAESPVGTG